MWYRFYYFTALELWRGWHNEINDMIFTCTLHIAQSYEHNINGIAFDWRTTKYIKLMYIHTCSYWYYNPGQGRRQDFFLGGKIYWPMQKHFRFRYKTTILIQECAVVYEILSTCVLDVSITSPKSKMACFLHWLFCNLFYSATGKLAFLFAKFARSDSISCTLYIQTVRGHVKRNFELPNSFCVLSPP